MGGNEWARGPGTQRLDKVLAATGMGTRKEVRDLIKRGRVTVEGATVTDPATHVRPGLAQIQVDGKPIRIGPLVLMLNKPAGVVTARSDRRHRTVLDLLPPELGRRLFPVGRLDKDTEGLLLLTDDGALCHALISPRHAVEKEYLAKVDGALPPDLPAAFAAGVRLDDGYVTRPARLTVLEPGPPGVARVVVTEGKFHQIKRMFAAFGLTVTYLRRLRVGGLWLDETLPPGGYRFLSGEELALLLPPPDRPPRGGPAGESGGTQEEDES